MTGKLRGEEQGANGPPSIEHSNEPPGSPAIPIAALVELVRAGGAPVSSGTPGGRLSTVQLRESAGPRLPVSGSK